MESWGALDPWTLRLMLWRQHQGTPLLVACPVLGTSQVGVPVGQDEGAWSPPREGEPGPAGRSGLHGESRVVVARRGPVPQGTGSHSRLQGLWDPQGAASLAVTPTHMWPVSMAHGYTWPGACSKDPAAPVPAHTERPRAFSFSRPHLLTVAPPVSPMYADWPCHSVS